MVSRKYIVPDTPHENSNADVSIPEPRGNVYAVDIPNSDLTAIVGLEPSERVKQQFLTRPRKHTMIQHDHHYILSTLGAFMR
jgi:hypothetical protein